MNKFYRTVVDDWNGSGAPKSHRETSKNEGRRSTSTGKHNNRPKATWTPSNSPVKIKINSLEENLSGWDYQPCLTDLLPPSPVVSARSPRNQENEGH